VRRSIKYGVYTMVLGGMVAGTLAWVMVDKTVNIQVDGQTRTIHTVSRTVSGALGDAHISVDSHDVVAPASTAHIKDGSTIVVRYGRLLHLTVDGQPKDVWVTAATVSDALSQLGYDSGSYSSVSRSKRLPLDPTSIDLRTPKAVTVVADGAAHPLMTIDSTASAAVADAGVTVSSDDLWSVPAETPVTAGLTITISRVVYTEVTLPVDLPFDTSQADDATLATGKTVVDTKGANGAGTVTYKVKLIDGVEASRDLETSATVTAPVTQVQRVGTKAATVTATPATTTPATTTTTTTAAAPAAATPDPGSAQGIAHDMVIANGWSESDFSCLVSLWNRESGWRVNAANASGAYGIPQALPGSKMASFGADWQTNPATQIAWGLSYISGRYGTPCGAWAHSQSSGWY
jgi:uncharacterized protein YabE (DUF348 family)